MGRKILVQMPSYCYLDLSPQLIQALLNAPVYERKWEEKKFYKDLNGRIELVVVDESEIIDEPYVEGAKNE